MMLMRGRKSAITIVPTTTARNTIMIGRVNRDLFHSSWGSGVVGKPKTGGTALLNRDALSEVARLIDIAAERDGKVIGQ